MPYYYGYQVTVGPDGKPHVREFGNVRPSSRGLVGQVEQTQTSSVREPLVDAILDEKQNTLVITAEMPGITKEDIKIHLGEGVVTLHAEKGEKKYHKAIPVEHELDENSAKAAYTNGIVELKDKTKGSSKEERPRRKDRVVEQEEVQSITKLSFFYNLTLKEKKI